MSNSERGKVVKPVEAAPIKGAISNTGDGPPCPIDPTHGRTYALPHGRFYCPHSAHMGNTASSEVTQHFFTDDELVH